MKRFAVVSMNGLFVLILALACSRGGAKMQISPREQYDIAMKHYEKGDYLKAQSAFQRVVYSFPGLTFIDTAQFYMAMSNYNISSYPEAAVEYKRLLQTYPGSSFADDAQYYLAMTHYKESPNYSKDQTETYFAIDEFSVLLDKFPSSSYASDAREKLDILYDKLAKKLFKSGALYLKTNDYEPSLIYFGQVRDNYPNTQWAVLAMYYSGEAQMKLGQKSDALETFQNFVIAFPEHKLVARAQKMIARLTPTQASGS